MWVADEVDIFFREGDRRVRPLGSLGWTFGDDAMDLPEVVSALSLVFEVQGGTSGDGHDHPEGW